MSSNDQKGKRRSNRTRDRRPRQQQQPKTQGDDHCRKKLLVLHGSRQTGPLLLGRMAKLRKSLQQEGIKLVTADGPFDHPEDPNLRQWWNRHNNTYQGMETSIQLLQDMWDAEGEMVGILGFSQGARLAHLIALLHQTAKSTNSVRIPFTGLQFSIMVAGYEAPLPDNWGNLLKEFGMASANKIIHPTIETSSLHIWGISDPLIPPPKSQAVMKMAGTGPSTHSRWELPIPTITPATRPYRTLSLYTRTM